MKITNKPIFTPEEIDLFLEIEKLKYDASQKSFEERFEETLLKATRMYGEQCPDAWDIKLYIRFDDEDKTVTMTFGNPRNHLLIDKQISYNVIEDCKYLKNILMSICDEVYHKIKVHKNNWKRN